MLNFSKESTSLSAIILLTCNNTKTVGCRWNQLSPEGLDLFFLIIFFTNSNLEKKYWFVFLPRFYFKNNACLHKSTHLSHMVLIFLCDSCILPQICADKIAVHSILIFFFIFKLGQALCPNLNFLSAKHIQNGTIKHARDTQENFIFLYPIDKNILHSGSSYICTYIFITRGRDTSTTLGTFCWLTHFTCLVKWKWKAKQVSHLVASTHMFEIS